MLRSARSRFCYLDVARNAARKVQSYLLLRKTPGYRRILDLEQSDDLKSTGLFLVAQWLARACARPRNP